MPDISSMDFCISAISSSWDLGGMMTPSSTNLL